MIRLLRFGFRLAARLGFRWAVLSAVARFIMRRVGRSTVEQAGRELSSVAVGAAKTTAAHTRAVVARGRSAVDDAKSELEAETASSRRQLKARYLEATIGRGPATDALLDIRSAHRPQRRGGDHLDTDLVGELAVYGPELDDLDDDPHLGVPEPVSGGRRRHRRQPLALVNRMRRTYRPPTKPWEGRR